MPRYKVTLMEENVKELEAITQKGGKGYRIKHAHILLKLNERPKIELSILSRQALSKPKPDEESFTHAGRSWTFAQNAECRKIHWQFTTADARIKFATILL